MELTVFIICMAVILFILTDLVGRITYQVGYRNGVKQCEQIYQNVLLKNQKMNQQLDRISNNE